MKKYGRQNILAGQIMTLVLSFICTLYSIYAIVLTTSYYLIIDTILASLICLACVAAIPISIVGIIQSKLPKGLFKKGPAIMSLIFSSGWIVFSIYVLIQSIVTSEGNEVNTLPLTVFGGSFLLLLVGIISASKEKKPLKSEESEFQNSNSSSNPTTKPMSAQIETPQEFKNLSSDSSAEKAAWTNSLCALWKLYEQHLITEEEYLTQRNTIFALSRLK